MASGSPTTVHFPFPVRELRCTVTGLPADVPSRSALLCLRAERRLTGARWSPSLGCNYAYVEFEQGQGTASTSVVIETNEPWQTGEIYLQPWGEARRRTDVVPESIQVSATGVMGEEMREFVVTYQWSPVA